MDDALRGRWVTAREYARIFGLSPQGLANMRLRERKLGRRSPSAPIWARFGRAIRYFIPDDLLNLASKNSRDPLNAGT
jgi:hypothetical protein